MSKKLKTDCLCELFLEIGEKNDDLNQELSNISGIEFLLFANIMANEGVYLDEETKDVAFNLDEFLESDFARCVVNGDPDCPELLKEIKDNAKEKYPNIFDLMEELYGSYERYSGGPYTSPYTRSY